jgi:hypothetical protein
VSVWYAFGTQLFEDKRGDNLMRKKIQLIPIAIGMLLAPACGSSTSSDTSKLESSVVPLESVPGEVESPVSTEANPPNDSEPEGYGAYVAEGRVELLFSFGNTAELGYQIGEVFTLTDPNSEIVNDCPSKELPAAGTSYQAVRLSFTSTSSRPFDYPYVVLGYLNDSGEFNRFDPNARIGKLSDISSCIPKIFLDFDIGSMINSASKAEIRPTGYESVEIVTKIEPNVSLLNSWAILVTEYESEIGYYGLSVDQLSPTSRIIKLNQFGQTVLNTNNQIAEPTSSKAELLCAALRGETRGTAEEFISLLKELASEVTISTLSSYALQTAAYLEENPDDDFLPYSQVNAISECDELGL